MTTVRGILSQKGHDVWSVSPQATLRDALQVLSDHDIGAVVVVDQGQLVGIFSERDLARQLAISENLSLDTPISKLMTSQVYYVKPDQFVEDCMALMSEKHIRHLPVLEGEKIVGMVSIGDIVKEQVSQKDITIRSLENYIMGREYS